MAHNNGGYGLSNPLTTGEVDLNRLSEDELPWVDRQPFLASKGYTLRPRYQPGWIPSWLQDPTLVRPLCPDHVHLPLRRDQIDATTAGGRLVYLKRVRSDSDELRITRMFSHPLLRGDPQNHCVPLLDEFPDDQQPGFTYMVMPFLLPMYEPPFYWQGDVVDFVDQVLEGLAFMHKHNVAHRDCADENIMADADSLFPRGYHPVLTPLLPDLKGKAPSYTRLEAPKPVRYSFIDFGISSHIPSGQSKLVLGIHCMDEEVPELSNTVPYDAFKVDIFILGNVLRRNIYDSFHRVGFLKPLIAEMTRQNPDARPDAEAALAHWKRIRARVCMVRFICRLRHRDESFLGAAAYDFLAFLKLLVLLSKRFAKWSVDWLRILFLA